jgi:hypothetical protein
VVSERACVCRGEGRLEVWLCTVYDTHNRTWELGALACTQQGLCCPVQLCSCADHHSLLALLHTLYSSNSMTSLPVALLQPPMHLEQQWERSDTVERSTGMTYSPLLTSAHLVAITVRHSWHDAI